MSHETVYVASIAYVVLEFEQQFKQYMAPDTDPVVAVVLVQVNGEYAASRSKMSFVEVGTSVHLVRPSPWKHSMSLAIFCVAEAGVK
jgi:hypothetical protein